jgi:CheY-like chemotaxis protein/anti-sigma regulatory factor (Ser/Thr protein kinase)
VSALTAARRTEGREVVVEARPAWISGDGTRAEQIVMNLMTNALKFTPPGGRVTIRTGRSGDDAVLTVEDTGAGIPPALLPRVFDLFVQGERGLDRAAGGLGIGLTLVRRLVELHGGTITATSGGPGRGSTFTVRLRAIQPPTDATAHGPAGAAVAPRAVLVVDDNADAREMLRTMLVLAGHTVYEAEDGPCAVDTARSKRPEVAFVDIGLPGFDGYEVARRIRAEEGGAKLVLVALTGYGQLEDRERALAAGFDRHLTKPVAAETLTEILSAR